MEFHVDYAFYLDGSKLRRDYVAHPPGATPDQPVRELRRISSFDGKRHRRLTYSLADNLPNDGRDEQGRHATDTRLVALKPVIWAFRILDPEFCTLPLGEFDHAGVESIDDSECIVLERKRGTGRESFWFAVAEDYVVRRYAVKDLATGRTSLQIDMVNRPDEVAGWVPMRWTTVVTTPGGLTTTASAVVKDYQINPDIPADQFAITFPDDTYVIERDDGRERHYLIRADGSQREILPEELGRPWDDLSNTEPAGFATGRAAPLRRWIVLLNAVAVVAAGIVLWLRVRRSRARQP